jgi:hypothetical protein
MPRSKLLCTALRTPLTQRSTAMPVIRSDPANPRPDRPAYKKEPRPCFHGRGVYLATTYSHRTCRPTTIGAEAFHFRVRNGTGWFHLALVTRGQCWGWTASAMQFQDWVSGGLSCFFKIRLIRPIGLIRLISQSRPLPGIHMEVFPIRLPFFASYGALVSSDSKNRNQAERMISSARL